MLPDDPDLGKKAFDTGLSTFRVVQDKLVDIRIVGKDLAGIWADHCNNVCLGVSLAKGAKQRRRENDIADPVGADNQYSLEDFCRQG